MATSSRRGRTLTASIAILLLTGCAHWFGPADGVFVAVGSTPSYTPCELTVIPVGSQARPKSRMVSGEFRERFIINPNRKGHRLALTCDNTEVASRIFKYGRDVVIGGEVAINVAQR